MVDNQHKKIKGYRDLSQEEIELMNEVKEKAEEVGELIQKISDFYYSPYPTASNEYADKRWLAIAKTDLQKGFMFLVRAIVKPESF